MLQLIWFSVAFSKTKIKPIKPIPTLEKAFKRKKVPSNELIVKENVDTITCLMLKAVKKKSVVHW